MVTNEKLRALVDAKRRKDRTKAAADEAAAIHKQLQEEVWSAMETNGDKTLMKDLGPGYGNVQFGCRQTIYSRILDIDVAAKSLSDLGMEHMLKADVQKRMLNELVREYIEQGRPLPDGVDFYSADYVAISIK